MAIFVQKNRDAMPVNVKQRIFFSEIGGIKTRYRISGEGFPIFFIHGLMGSIEQEDMLAGDKVRLAEKYMVVHYDCRGRGKTAAGGYETRLYTWEAIAEHLWALMQAVGVNRAHLIGGSMGAATVLAFAIKRPGAVASMVLHNPVEVRRLDPKYVGGILDYADFIEREGMDAVTDLILALPPNDTLRTTHPHIWRGYDKIMRSQNARVVAAATRGMVCSNPIDEEQLHQLKSPALVISSEGDGLHPTDVGQFLKESIPDARAFFGPTMTFFYDNPHLVPRRILEFYSEIDGTKWD